MKRLTAALIGVTVLAGCAAAHPAFSFDSPRMVLARSNEQNTAAPRMFFIASGKLYMLMGTAKGDTTGLRLRISEDDGDDFSQAIDVSPKDASPMLHGEMSPQLSYDPHKQRMYVLYETEREGVDHLEVVASSVWSKRFKSPVAVVRKTTPSPNTFAALGVAANGNVFVAWLDGRRTAKTAQNTYALYIVRSRDGARSFEEPILVAADVCPCCRPALAFDAAGNVFVAWRRVYPGNFRDIVVARASQTLHFNAPTRVSADGWSIPCLTS